MNRPIQVALVEDHVLLAQSLLVALSAEGLHATTVPVPGTPGTAVDLLQPILSLQPDIVLLDLDLGIAGDATPLVGSLTKAGCAVVVITGSYDAVRWGACLARGARTVLPKCSPLESIVDTVRRISAGAEVLPEATRSDLVQLWLRERTEYQVLRGRLNRLTRRESEVLAALTQGQRVRDIAADSYVSEATVRSQVKAVLAKLGVTSQIAAVALARDVGWTPVPDASWAGSTV